MTTEVEIYLVGIDPAELQLVESGEVLKWEAAGPVMQFNMGANFVARVNCNEQKKMVRISRVPGVVMPRWQKPAGFSYQPGQRFLTNLEHGAGVSEVVVLEVADLAIKFDQPLVTDLAHKYFWWRKDVFERAAVELLPEGSGKPDGAGNIHHWFNKLPDMWRQL